MTVGAGRADDSADAAAVGEWSDTIFTGVPVDTGIAEAAAACGVSTCAGADAIGLTAAGAGAAGCVVAGV